MSEVYDYSPLQATATALIEKYGRKVTLRRRVSGPADPLKPWEGSAPPTGAETIPDVSAVFVSFTAEDRAASPSITQKDKRVLLGVQSEEIDQDWEIVDDDGSVWKVASVLDSVKPGPLQMIYDLQVRV